MLQSPKAPETESQEYRQLYEKAFRWTLLARLLDEKMASLYRGGKIYGGVFLGKGQEALSASLGIALRKGDVFAPLIRDLAGRLAFGESMLDVVRTYLGSPLGPMRGRDGNVHRGRISDGMLPMISHLGSMISVTTGVLFAKRAQGEKDFVGATCIGDGGTSTGSFHEGVNLAAVEHLPLVIVVANNQYAYSTPTNRQFVCEDLIDKAIGYGVNAHAVDGTDLAACVQVLGDAVQKARAGGGPQMIVASLLRLSGHGEHDDASYVAPVLKNSALGRDCLQLGSAQIEQWHGQGIIEEWRKEFSRKIDETVATVQREAPPDPYQEEWKAIKSQHLLEGNS